MQLYKLDWLDFKLLKSMLTDSLTGGKTNSEIPRQNPEVGVLITRCMLNLQLPDSTGGINA